MPNPTLNPGQITPPPTPKPPVTFGHAILSLGFIAVGLAIWALLAAATPAPPPGPSAIVQLGQALFADENLSNPKGLSCITCHSPPAGWTYSDSSINEQFGPVPGAVPGRFGNRRPPTISYAVFMKDGPPAFNQDLDAFAGGFFYDGRAANLSQQVPGPLENPNEMNNTPAGVVAAVTAGPQAALFRQAYGVDIYSLSVEEAFADITDAIVAFESTPALSPFNSKFDACIAGQAQLTPAEMAGLQLFTGSATGRPGGPPPAKSANCIACHEIASTAGDAPDLFTANAYYNLGTPKNPTNPFYTQTNAATNPEGYNPLGAAYIDYGLGDFLYPNESLPAGNVGRSDFLQINGSFKTPTLRNVDARPDPDFVKCYGHNGYFKSLAQVVHFLNTRNLTTSPGEVINFTKANPYAGLKGKPLWPAPESPSPTTMVNPTGARNGLVGNLGLTATDEANLVAFLQTLSDAPPPPPPPEAPTPPEAPEPPTAPTTPTKPTAPQTPPTPPQHPTAPTPPESPAPPAPPGRPAVADLPESPDLEP